MKETNVNPINNALLNVIAPMGIEISKNSITVGENSGKIYGVVKYPTQIDYGWLSKLTNIPGTMASVTFQPMDNAEFISALNKNIGRNRAQEKEAKDTLLRQRAKKAADDGERLLLQIDQDGETVGMLGTCVMPIASEAEMFKRISRKVESSCAAAKCKARLLAYLQKEGFKQISPMYTVDEDINQITGRVAPLSAVMGGFANSSSGYNDGTGYYVAKDASGGLVVLDLWKRGGDRTNSNMVVMGVPGQGKSTDIKHLISSETMMGTKVIIVDPEGEYKELCLELGGEWIDAGGGSKGRINPLEIRPIPKSEENDKDPIDPYIDEGNGMGEMALYIKHLEVFFSLYIPSLTDLQRAILKSSLIELYNQFNIAWDTDIKTLKPEDFPVMKDLYELLIGKAEEKEKVRRDSDSNPYADLATLLEDIAIGSDSFLWNGHTTLSTNARVVCLDTSALQDAGDNIKCTQYFNINTWTWNEMSKDRNEKVFVIYDEAYLMIDRRVPQSLVHLRNSSKRARKYEAAIAIISHSVVDFLDPSIKLYGQALLDTPCYKILMGCDGQNLKETVNLYNLTDSEEELLASKRRGHALMMIGSKRLHVDFEIPDYKWKYFGTAGGR